MFFYCPKRTIGNGGDDVKKIQKIFFLSKEEAAALRAKAAALGVSEEEMLRTLLASCCPDEQPEGDGSEWR